MCHSTKKTEKIVGTKIELPARAKCCQNKREIQNIFLGKQLGNLLIYAYSVYIKPENSNLDKEETLAMRSFNFRNYLKLLDLEYFMQTTFEHLLQYPRRL